MRDNSSRSSTNNCAATILVLQYTYDIVCVLAKNTWLRLAITFDNLRIEKVRSVVFNHDVDAERNRLHREPDLLSFYCLVHTLIIQIVWAFGNTDT